MTGSYRKLGLLLAAAMLTAPAALAQDVSATFKEAVGLLQRDLKPEALQKLQAVLALDPTSEQVLALWTETDGKVWIELLGEGGEIERVTQRLMGLAKVARRAHQNDSEAIQKLITDLRENEPIARRRAISALAANHGEYAVPHLLGWLGDTGNEEHRITAIQALTEMNTDVVPALLEVLDSDDAFLRRNVVGVLKTIGDPRAAGALAAMAKNDVDGACRTVAADALAAVKSSGDACRDLRQAGEDYHMRRGSVLADYQWSDVVWNWTDGKLVPTETPRGLYADELAKKSFQRALKADPTCADAHSGLARANAGQLASLDALAHGGVDTSAWSARVEGNQVALGLAGPAALDAALAKSIAQNDAATAVVLVRALAESAPAPTAAMTAALRSTDGAVRSEAAVALGRMATWGKSKSSPALVSALGAVAGREIVRLAFVIDADAARGAKLAEALTAAGMHVSTATTGTLGLTTLRRMPGLDALVVSDTLPDLSTHQVLDEVRAEPAFASAPRFVISASPDGVAEAFGDKVTGALSDPSDVSAVTAALASSMGSDRERADALAGEAATVLMTLAGTGADISGAVDALASTLGRTDGVALPAAYALGAAGGANHVTALASVVGDTARSDAVREAAGHALASIFGRGAAAGDSVQTLHDVASSDAAINVRKAAAQALGNLQMSAQDRAAHLAQ